MQKVLIAVAMVLMAVGLAAASDTSDAMAPVQKFVDSFNKGDAKGALATCAEDAAIIDEFPPYVWHGAGACSAWMKGYQASAKQEGSTDGMVVLGKPRHVEVTGNFAYVVVPADFTHKLKGEGKKESNATFILTLKKGSAGWLITGWAWGAPQ